MTALFPLKLDINWYYYSLIFSFPEGNVVELPSSMICRGKNQAEVPKTIFFPLNERKLLQLNISEFKATYKVLTW